jgi:hypothetical protein
VSAMPIPPPASTHYSKRRLNMKSILLVVGIAVLLASPAMAQQQRRPNNATVPDSPSDARASVAGTNTPYRADEGGLYTPSIPTLPTAGIAISKTGAASLLRGIAGGASYGPPACAAPGLHVPQSPPEDPGFLSVKAPHWRGYHHNNHSEKNATRQGDSVPPCRAEWRALHLARALVLPELPPPRRPLRWRSSGRVLHAP